MAEPFDSLLLPATGQVQFLCMGPLPEAPPSAKPMEPFPGRALPARDKVQEYTPLLPAYPVHAPSAGAVALKVREISRRRIACWPVNSGQRRYLDRPLLWCVSRRGRHYF